MWSAPEVAAHAAAPSAAALKVTLERIQLYWRAPHVLDGACKFEAEAATFAVAYSTDDDDGYGLGFVISSTLPAGTLKETIVALAVEAFEVTFGK